MNKLFCFLLFLFCTVDFWPQSDKSENTIEVIYTKGYKNYRDTISTPPRLMKDLEYQLLCNNNESRFEYLKTMSNDGTTTNERFIGRGGGRGVHYVNLKQNKNFRAVNKNEVDILVNQEFHKFGWKLLKETKKILGFDCFKAIGKYDEFSFFFDENHTFTVTAWYTPSISVPFGPAGYDGLPGLVLEASRGSFYFIATDIKFHKKAKSIKRPENGMELDEYEFNKFLFDNMLKRHNLTEEEWREMNKNRKPKK